MCRFQFCGRYCHTFDTVTIQTDEKKVFNPALEIYFVFSPIQTSNTKKQGSFQKFFTSVTGKHTEMMSLHKEGFIFSPEVCVYVGDVSTCSYSSLSLQQPRFLSIFH